jgi:hypothetical protein
MDVLPKRENYAGKHWTFTPDGKQFFSLGLFSDDVHPRELIEAYQRHPKRRPAGVNIEFVYRDETSKDHTIVKRHSMANIVAQLESSPKPETELRLAPDSIKAVQRNLARLQTDGDARREMAIDLIRKSAWWDTHVHGPVRSPNDCEHLRIGRYGLEVYSGNRFLVERAIRECASFIGEIMDALAASEAPSRRLAGRVFRALLQERVHGCVANIYYELYPSYREKDLMRFGGHSINVKEFVDEWCRLCELDRVFA